MTSPVHDADHLKAATERLLNAVAELDAAALSEPSQLPGWTRGHVLAHLARNADALVEVLAGRPMYASAEARDADIERDSSRPLDVQLDDLRTTADRLAEAFAAETEESWRRSVELRNGVTDLAASLPFRRWIEVDLHHVDLGIGYGLADLPGVFLDRELENMAKRFSRHPSVPEAIELRVEDGRVLHTGAAPGTATGAHVIVSGGATALVGWLTGRTPGTALSSSTPLPALPTL